MKNGVLTLFALIAFYAVKAQFPSIGIQTGISYSDFHLRYNEKLSDTNRPANLDYKGTAFSYTGIYITLWQNNHFALRPGMALLSKGFRDNFYFVDSQGNIIGRGAVTERVRYFSFSCDLLASLNNKNRFKPYLVIGPRADDMVSQGNKPYYDRHYTKTHYNYTRTIWGINTGAGVKYDLGEKFALSGEMVYRWQITGIYHPNAVIRDGYHRCFTAAIGLQYNFPKREDEAEKAPDTPF